MDKEVLIVAIIFIVLFQVVKLLTDYALKRRLIKENQVDKVESLVNIQNNSEPNSYPTLKWGLVAFFGGLGFIIIELLRVSPKFSIDMYRSFLPYGILLVTVALGFLLYFFIVRKKD